MITIRVNNTTKKIQFLSGNERMVSALKGSEQAKVDAESARDLAIEAKNISVSNATQTNLDKIATNADRVAVAADRVVVETKASEVASNASQVQSQTDAIGALYGDASQIHADALQVASDKATTVEAKDLTLTAKGQVDALATQVTNDKNTVAVDKGIVAADKAIVAADKTTTLGYKNDAETAKTGAETARDLAITNAALAGNTRIQDWVAQSYVALSQVIKDGVWWVLPDGVSALSTDVPGVSSKWVQRAKYLCIGGYNPVTNTPALNATPNSALLDESFYIVDTTGCVSFLGENFVVGFMFQRGDRLIKRGTTWVVDINDRNILNGTTINATSSTAGKFYKYDTGVITTSTGYTIYKFPVLDSKKYMLSGNMIGAATSLAVFFDASDNYLGYQDQAIISSQTYRFLNRKLTLPAGTAFVGVSIKDANISSLVLKEITSEVSVRDTVVLNTSEISSIKTVQTSHSTNLAALNSTFSSVIDEVGFVNYDNEYYNKNTGSRVSHVDYYSRLYPIASYDMFVTTKFQGTLIAMAVFFDSGLNYLGSQLPNATSGVTIVHDLVKVVAPTGTAFIGITSQKTFLAVPKISKYGDMPELKDIVASVFASPLFNKTIAAVGDSITNGISASSITDKFTPLSGSVYKSYPYFIAKRTGAKWHNYGVSGSTLGDCFTGGSDKNGFSKAGGRYTQMADNLDYIVLMFGTNDTTYGQQSLAEDFVETNYGTRLKWPTSTGLIGTTGYMTQVQYDAVIALSGTVGGISYTNGTGLNYFKAMYTGTVDDTTNKTFAGAFNIVIPYLINKYPLAKILIWFNPTNNRYDVITKALCEKWGLPYLDMHDSNQPILWYKPIGGTGIVNGVSVTQFRKDTLTSDGVHPNDAGYEFLSTIIENALLRI